MALNTVNDFTGEFQLAVNGKTTDELEAVIELEEKRHLYSMLGKELAELYLADVAKAEVDREQRFKDLQAPIWYSKGCHVYETEGMNNLLRHFIYFYYVRKQGQRNTIVGNQKNVTELGEYSGTAYILAMYNRGVSYYHNLQRYVGDNKDLYPEFEGLILKYASLI